MVLDQGVEAFEPVGELGEIEPWRRNACAMVKLVDERPADGTGRKAQRQRRRDDVGNPAKARPGSFAAQEPVPHRLAHRPNAPQGHKSGDEIGDDQPEVSGGEFGHKLV